MTSAVLRHSVLSAVVLVMTATIAPAQPETEWAAVEQALAYKGAVQPGGVFRVGMPRTDLKVTVQGVEVRPGFALGSYASARSEEHTSELQSRPHLVCRLLLEKKKSKYT